MSSSTPTLLRETETSLQQSRIGTVLISAAIIDDVVGLVIASLIPALASVDSDAPQRGRGNLPWTIVRPLLSSFLIAAIASAVARFVLRPLFWFRAVGKRWCAPAREGKPWGVFRLSKEGSGWGTAAHADTVKLLIMVATVSGMAAIANYTCTSILYGAYVAGLVLTYMSRPPSGEGSDDMVKELSFEETFGRTIGPLQSTLLLPLFFSSIGFAIPFLDLWHPAVIWRGIVYSALMGLGKLAVGLPILVYPVTLSFVRTASKKLRNFISRLRTTICLALCATVARLTRRELPPATHATLPHTSIDQQGEDNQKTTSDVDVSRSLVVASEESILVQTAASAPAAVFMGVAMVSRGEIGLLIAQLARGDNSGGESGLLGDEAFLLCIWAILLCTLIGPIGTGMVVGRWGSKITSSLWA